MRNTLTQRLTRDFYNRTLMAFFAMLLPVLWLAGSAEAQIPTAAQLNNPVAYYNSDQGLFSDLAKTVPITATGVQVAVWADQSGSGYDFVQSTVASRPVSSGVPGSINLSSVLFGLGGTTFLDGGNPAGLNLSAGSYTIMVVADSTATTYSTLLSKNSSGGQARMWFLNNNSGGFDRFNSGLGVKMKSNSLSEYEFIQSAGNNGVEKLRSNGTFLRSGTRTLPNWDSTSNYRMGTTTDNAFPMQGRIFCFLIYNKLLNDTQRRSVEAVLSAYYHFPRSVSSDTTKSVVIAGNSLMSGTGSSVYGDVGTQLSRLLGDKTIVYNIGVTSTTTAYWASSGTIDGFYQSAVASNNILSYYEGTNDMGSGALTALQTYNAHKTFLAARKSVGFRVIEHTCITNSLDADATRQAFNALLRADFTTPTIYNNVFLPTPGVTYADILVDIAAEPLFWSFGPGNTAANNLSIDGTHLTDAGYAIFAANDANAVNCLVPTSTTGGTKRRTQ